MPRIKVLTNAEATDRLKDIYSDITKKRGKLANVHTIQSLHPESIVAHMNLYMEIMFSQSVLSRAEREMMAVVVSVANGCAYCQVHHAQALQHYWKDEIRIAKLKAHDFETICSAREKALCEFAKHLTLHPQDHENNDYIQPLRLQGIGDEGILDTVLVIAYFNFVNRIVLSLGVELENDKGTGYKY